MRDYFIFGELNTLDYLMYAANKNLFDGGGKNIETVKIPGRNGTLSLSDDTFDNVTITYEMYCKGDITRDISAFRSKISASSGYCRLEDSFEPDIYMRARYSKPFQVTNYDRTKAAFDVSFDCDPRKFLKSGEKARELTSSISIKNPTCFDALPLMRVYGTGSVTIAGVSIVINSANVYTDIDCELQEAYKGTTNCNGNITLTNGKFPSLKPGVNNIFISGVSKVEITPRWWIL
ncbi:MAG: hypothetical protein K5870_05450 [Lachnospiraceae bacterium]|nr:hypothetical protein [Lachnospiraceae bacterium]